MGDDCGEGCVCCSVPYESFCETLPPTQVGQECVCGQCSGAASIVCYEHKISQPKGCEKEETKKKEVWECKCGVCGGVSIFYDNHVEFEDGEEREKVCCPCTECANAPIWDKPVWKNPNLQTLVDRTENLMVGAGEAIEKMVKDMNEIDERKPRKFCQNQEQDAYENDW